MSLPFEDLLLQYGLAGAVLAWFMLRTEKRLEQLKTSVDRMVKALMVVQLAQANRPEVEQQVKGILEEIENEMKRPNGG